uniref:Uncharacterized protein n=1 Tax=Arundo donax TaxID=35708 RepID=A0A0A9CIH5_ARUDO
MFGLNMCIFKRTGDTMSGATKQLPVVLRSFC